MISICYFMFYCQRNLFLFYTFVSIFIVISFIKFMLNTDLSKPEFRHRKSCTFTFNSVFYSGRNECIFTYSSFFIKTFIFGSYSNLSIVSNFEGFCFLHSWRHFLYSTYSRKTFSRKDQFSCIYFYNLVSKSSNTSYFGFIRIIFILQGLMYDVKL